MKKLYTLLLLSLLTITGIAQVTVTVNAVGASGSYKTGYAQNLSTPTRNDGNLNVNYQATSTATVGAKRGWAVFSLAGLVPSGATITSAKMRYTIVSTTSTTANPTCSINAFAGDLSTIPSAATVYADCAIAGQAVYSTTFGTATGTFTVNLLPYAVTFLNTWAPSGSIVSFGFVSTSNTGQTYVITGEGGSAATQPQLQITYTCTGLTTATASASPVPVCIGSPLTLTGSAGGTDIDHYSWAGPGGYTSTSPTPPAFNATAATAGTYTFTAYNSVGCPVATTVNVTTNITPDPITGNLAPCLGTTTALATSPATGGTWSINGTTGASISGTGVVTTGATAGTSTVSYTLSTGCRATTTVTTLDTPTAISLPSYICGGTTYTLSSSPAGGAWTVNPASVASINPTTGDFLGLSNGMASITYTGSNGCRTMNATPVIMPPASTNSSSTGSFFLCPAHGLTLTNAVPGGTWSADPSGNVTVSGTGFVNGVTLGAAVVTYTNVCGIATTDITVDPPPPAITGTFSTCVNAMTTLHDGATGGIWTSSNTALAVAAAGFGTVTGVAAGAVTITYTDVTGCFVTTPFTVNPIPDPITGPASACAGTTVILSETSTGGIWSSSDSFIASIDTGGKVRGLIASTATITYTLPAHGCYITRPFTVNPLPVAITGNNIMCNLKSETLSDVSLGGSWTSSNTGIAVIAPDGVVTGVNSGTATITYTLPTGCIRTRPVTIRALPNAVLTYNFFTETLSTGTFYTSYQWYQGGVAIPGANSNSVAATDPSTYSVYVTDTFGCEKMSSVYNVTSVGINQPDPNVAIRVQPNPTSGVLTIISPIAVNAVITGVDGRVVMEQANATKMDISQLANGMYMIMLYDAAGRKVSVEKVIKQ